jgi:hypothetical protein
MFPSIDGRKKRYPTKNPLHRNCWIYKRFLELAERLDSLASAGEDTENVESDLKRSMSVCLIATRLVIGLICKEFVLFIGRIR